METPAAWLAEGQVVWGDAVADLGVDFPVQVNGHDREGPVGGSTFHQILPHPDFRPFVEDADQRADGAQTGAQTVEAKEAVADIGWDAASTQPTPVPEVSALSSRAPSQTYEEVEEGSATPVEFEVHRSKHVYVELPRSTLAHPRSQYEGYTPPLPISKEREALASLIEVAESLGNTSGEYEFELDAFSFYVNSALYPHEMRPLHHLATRQGHDQFYFDGILSIGSVKHYVRRVAVSELPIGNYGADHDTVNGQIWVRSMLNRRREIYYRLKGPSYEYERFHTPFLWLADLAKHVVDYSAAMIDQRCPVGIDAFKAHFLQWLCQAHGKSAEFKKWRQKHPSPDYRTSVSANIEFIWKEMNGVLSWKKANSLQLFSEAMLFSQYRQNPVPSPPLPMAVQGLEEVPPTVVTPYVKECFGHMVIGKTLRVVGNANGQDTAPVTTHLSNGAGEKSGTPSSAASWVRLLASKRSRTSEACFLPLEAISQIKAGDTISTPRDGDHTGSKWRNMVSKDAVEDDRWFGLVQKVHVAKDESRSFDVTWFYRPVETPCCMMKYPWPNELFLSDHCTCEEGRGARVKEHEVLAVHDMDWFGSPNGKGEFFVRQTYMIEERRWITLQRSHMTCSHVRERLGFKAGDTVLATVSKSDEFAEPYEVVKVFRQAENMFVRLRRLLRRSRVDPEAGAAPNELVYTDQPVVVKPDRVLGKCSVRFFRSGDSIPTPYDRNGTGNMFFITHRLEPRDDGGEQCVPIEGDFPASLRQGFDPTLPVRKLRGMDLFCGSGNFGRGLEEGGAVEMHWANDIWDRAIHTYMANCPDPKSTHPFLGSVDDLLRLALEGKYADNVPQPREVDFISAGSPCPGFSLLTADKTTLAQIKNQSLVASFASFVDFYRPKYGILENVSGIVQARHNRSEDVLSQLFCAIVGMGYQAQLILGDAWSHGAPQSRNRVFLYFAAPGLRLPEAPLLSHSHYAGVAARDLGELCNGEPFVRRSFQRTPFKYISAAEGTADLPLIGDGKADPGAPAFPDHRVPAGMTRPLCAQITAIPKHPHGMRFATAWYGHGYGDGRDGGPRSGVMTRSDRALFPAAGSRVAPISQAWRRVRPNEVFQTITTRCQPTDARAGTGLHWADDRPLTIQEVRRAQGFPDEEVLLGSMADQWKLVGNSVARQMALALGLKFREAWVGGGSGERDGERSGSRSASVKTGSVRAVSVSVSAAEEVAVKRSGLMAVSSEMRATATVNGHNNANGEVIDLTTQAHATAVSRRHIISHEVVDLTETSRSATPVSVMSATTKTNGTRKRSLSQSTGAKIDEGRPKVIRLESELPSSEEPELEEEPEVELTNGTNHGPDAAQQEEDGMPVRTGPTIVRLWTPEDESEEPMSDGLGPGDELN